MAETPTLSAAVDGYIALYTASREPGSAKQVRMHLRQFLAFTGNLQMCNLTSDHTDRWFYTGHHGEPALSTRVAPSTLATYRTTMRGFEGWCLEKGYVRRRFMANVRKTPQVRHQHQHLSPAQMTEAMTSAPNARDRMLTALALFTGLRAQELCSRKIKNLVDDTDPWRLTVDVFKSKRDDIMPVGDQLRSEMVRWLTAYEMNVGNLHTAKPCAFCHPRFHGNPLCPEWYLVPARKSVPFARGNLGRADDFSHMRQVLDLSPTGRIKQPERIAHAVLDQIGCDGPKEGMHTFRRSAAMHMFETLREQGHDAALLITSKFLHHADVNTTIRYLNLDRFVEERDRAMLHDYRLPELALANVVPLLPRAEEGR